MHISAFLAVGLLLNIGAASGVEMTLKGKTVDVPVCGGFAGLECKGNEWCDYPQGVICGQVDHFGTCRPRPELCTAQYLPVCGCDGKTHSNVCNAAAAGVDVAHEGPCNDGS